MSIRKRPWTTSAGAIKTAWVVDYVDGKGTRRLKTFAKKKDANAFSATAKVEVREGTHVADSASATVAKAADLWILHCEGRGLERGTLAQYRQLVDLHIKPHIGERKLSALTVPAVRQFEDDLRAAGRSTSMAKKVLVALSSLLSDAEEGGLVGRNVVRNLRSRRTAPDGRQERRHKGKLRVGVDIPGRDEIKALAASLKGRWRPVLLTAIFTGCALRNSAGFDGSTSISTSENCTSASAPIGSTPSGGQSLETSERTVPLPPVIVNTLREWKVACPKGELDLVFPNGSGKIESIANIVKRGLQPAQIAAGVTKETAETDAKGKRVLAAKYPGMHALRHFYASWCINRTADGGLGLPLKVVQERLGHASIMLTSDRYGHLFPSGDDGEEMAAAERSLLG